MPPHIHSKAISGLTPLCSLAKTYPMWQPRKWLANCQITDRKNLSDKIVHCFQLVPHLQIQILKVLTPFWDAIYLSCGKIDHPPGRDTCILEAYPPPGIHLHMHFPVHVQIHNLYVPENIYQVGFFSLCLHLISPSILALSSFPVQLALGHFNFDLISQNLFLHDSSKFLHLLNYTMPSYYTVPI